MQDPIRSSAENVQMQFSTPVIILGGGEFAPEHLREFVARGYPLIAADGAADVAMALGLKLAAIIGDFDSIKDENAFGPEVKLIKLAEQESTDFEKCLYTVAAPLYICFGMLGKRVDHTLAAFHTIARHGARKHIVLMDQTDVSLGVVGDFKIDLPVGTRFSIYPLQPVRFAGSTGLRFPLDGLVLEVGRRIGTSNQTISPIVELSCEEKSATPYLVILPKAHFDAILGVMCRAAL